MHRVYIGSDNKTHTISSEMEAHVVDKFSKHFESFTCHRATGMFRGTKEDTLIVYIANIELEELKKVVSELRKELNQEGVGIETDGEYIRIID
jgi:uncharacterized membrane-anchored protein YitT (DUF2179 family)